MNSIWWCVNEGCSQRRIGSKKEAVLEEENESVEAVKIRMDQRMAGHQARNQGGSMDFAGTRARISSSCGAGRGLRQGSEGIGYLNSVKDAERKANRALLLLHKNVTDRFAQ